MNVYENALAAWGVDSQIEQLGEECAELILAIRHMKRGRCGAREFIEEMVDVEIMLTQMRMIFPLDVWEEIKTQKLIRLRERLKSEGMVKA